MQLYCCTLLLLAFSALLLPCQITFPSTNTPKITEIPSNHNKGYWPGNHWLHSQHGKQRDQWMLWKQDLLLWLQKTEWVPFKRTKVPSFSIRAGLVTWASVPSGLSLSSLRVWLCNKLFSIGQLLLMSSTNNDEAKKHKALFVICKKKNHEIWLDCSRYEYHYNLADCHVFVWSKGFTG